MMINKLSALVKESPEKRSDDINAVDNQRAPVVRVNINDLPQVSSSDEFTSSRKSSLEVENTEADSELLQKLNQRST